MPHAPPRLPLLFALLAVLLLAACADGGRPTGELPEPFILFTRTVHDPPLGRQVSELWRASLDGSDQKAIALPQPCGGVSGFNLSPDGRRLTFACDMAGTSLPLYALDFTTRETTLISSEPLGAGYWSPQGDQLTYMDSEGVHVLDIATGKDRIVFPAITGELGPWAPDGRITLNNVLYGPQQPSGGPGQWIYDTEAVLLHLVSGEGIELRGIERLGPWSPDGRRALASTRIRSGSPSNYPAPDFAAQIVDTATGERIPIPFEDANVGPAIWLSDGRSALVSVWRPTPPFSPPDCDTWKVDVLDPQHPTLLARDVCGPNYLSGDGRHLFFGRTRQLDGPPYQVGDLWRLDLQDGSESLLIENVGSSQFWEPPVSTAPPGP